MPGWKQRARTLWCYWSHRMQSYSFADRNRSRRAVFPARIRLRPSPRTLPTTRVTECFFAYFSSSLGFENCRMMLDRKQVPGAPNVYFHWVVEIRHHDWHLAGSRKYPARWKKRRYWGSMPSPLSRSGKTRSPGSDGQRERPYKTRQYALSLAAVYSSKYG